MSTLSNSLSLATLAGIGTASGSEVLPQIDKYQQRPGGLGPDGIPTGISPEAREKIIRERLANAGGDAILGALRKVGSSPEGNAIGVAAKRVMTDVMTDIKSQSYALNSLVKALVYPVKYNGAGLTPAKAIAGVGLSLQQQEPLAASTGTKKVETTNKTTASTNKKVETRPGYLSALKSQVKPVSGYGAGGGGQEGGGQEGGIVPQKVSITTLPSVLSQLVDQLTQINDNTKLMNSNTLGLLEAFKAANPVSVNNTGNANANAQEGGRRKTKVRKAKLSKKRRTRR